MSRKALPSLPAPFSTLPPRLSTPPHVPPPRPLTSLLHAPTPPPPRPLTPPWEELLTDLCNYTHSYTHSGPRAPGLHFCDCRLLNSGSQAAPRPHGNVAPAPLRSPLSSRCLVRVLAAVPPRRLSLVSRPAS